MNGKYMENNLSLLMAKSKIKKIDVSNEKPVKIIRGKMKGIELSKKDVSESNIEFESTFSLSSVIFSLQETCNRFGLKYDNVLVMVYLNELSVFRFDVEVIDRKIKLTEYKSLGFIIRDYSVKNKSYYRLTERAKRIVKFYIDSFSKNESFIGKNRVSELSAKDSLKKALNGYFS